MKRLNQALLAFSFAWGVYAESQRPNGCVPIPLEVVVWVNQEGVPLSTETNRIAATPVPHQQLPTPTPQLSISTPDANTPIAPAPTASQEDTPGTDKPVTTGRIEKEPHPHAHSHHHSHPHPSHPHEPPRQFGISYSPYNADRSCKTQEQVSKDVEKLSGYSFIRIYGTDCDQTKLVVTAARQHQMQVFAGIYDLEGYPASLDAFADAVTDPNGQKDWSIFHTIAIGNELVNGGTNSPDEVTAAVTQARSILRGQGYQGPVVTVDTFSVLLKHPELCQASDYCAANCHAFFDATQQSHNAGPYALEQAHSVSEAAGGKRTLITESGWPHAGEANGAAVPSPENQRAAIESLRATFEHRGDDLVLFTAFDDLWKEDNQYTFNAEHFWGIYHG